MFDVGALVSECSIRSIRALQKFINHIEIGTMSKVESKQSKINRLKGQIPDDELWIKQNDAQITAITRLRVT